ncbi:MAG: HD domain-containing protein [Patescibacteria group bacterium]
MKEYQQYFNLQEIIKGIKAYMPKFNEARFIEAFDFAELAHRGQLRKDGKTPYISHPVEIAGILTQLHADEDTLICALLHDVPEDTEYTLDQIREKFGEVVAFLVDGITKLSKVHYQHNMPNLQIDSLKKLFLHSGKDLRVIIIKLADRLHNMSTLQNVKEPEKRRRIATETLEIYVPIANLLGIQTFKMQLEDYCFKHLYPDEYEKLSKKYKASSPKRKELTEEFGKVVENACKDQNLDIEISSKHRNFFSIYKKLNRLGQPVDSADNRISVVIVVKNVSECYQVLGVVHSKFTPINDRFRDYIAHPKANGYQSLHTKVFGINGILTEVQISTKEMHFDAVYGVAASFFREQQLGVNDKRYGWLNKIMEIDQKDNQQNFLEGLKLDILQDRIFVFGQKGSAIDLPLGASALDFAYAINTETANHSYRADINGKMQPITTLLKTGDVIRMVSSKDVMPEVSWIAFTKTNLARSKILSYLNRLTEDQRKSEGFRILQEEFDIAGLGFCKEIKFKKLNEVLKQNSSKQFINIDELYTEIASGGLKAIDVVKIVKNHYRLGTVQTIAESEKNDAIRFSLKIVAENRFGLMKEISEVLYKQAIDMYSLKGWASKQEEEAHFTSELLVPNLESVSKLFYELQRIEGVKSVVRTSSKVMFSFYLGCIVTAGFWISHPYFLKLLNNSAFHFEHPETTNFIIYSGLFLLAFFVLYLTAMLRKYFPFLRHKKRIWIAAFLVPIAATGMLFLELFYYRLNLSILVICIELFVIYAYLIYSFLNFSKFKRQI